MLEADQVIASHTATGAENPNYPQELQPRDRSRDSSQAWVQKTSNTLDPESLTFRSCRYWCAYHWR